MHTYHRCFEHAFFSLSHLYSEHGLRAEGLELLLRVGVVVPLVALERGLLLGQRARLFVETGVDDVRALLFIATSRCAESQTESRQGRGEG